MRGGKILAVALVRGRGCARGACPAAARGCREERGQRRRRAETTANAFLASLPADLRAKSTFPLDSPERLAWHFVPKDRIGASLLELDDTQSELLGPLLATALSPEGLLEARGVMKHENILRRIETASGAPLASRRDPGKYHTAVFGAPSAAHPGPGASKDITCRSTSRSFPARRRSSRRCSSARIPRRCPPAPRPASGCWPPKRISVAS